MIYMYQVDPGRVYVYPEKIKRSQFKQVELPDGFDSVVVTLEDDEDSEEFNPLMNNSSKQMLRSGHSSSLIGYAHTFSRYIIIYDEERISPAYKIKFNFYPTNPNEEKMKNYNCIICKTDDVAAYCHTDGHFYCDKHDR